MGTVPSSAVFLQALPSFVDIGVVFKFLPPVAHVAMGAIGAATLVGINELCHFPVETCHMLVPVCGGASSIIL